MFLNTFPILTPNSKTTIERKILVCCQFFFFYIRMICITQGLNLKGRCFLQEDINPKTTQNQQKNTLKGASAMTLSVPRPDLNKAVDLELICQEFSHQTVYFGCTWVTARVTVYLQSCMIFLLCQASSGTCSS